MLVMDGDGADLRSLGGFRRHPGILLLPPGRVFLVFHGRKTGRRPLPRHRDRTLHRPLRLDVYGVLFGFHASSAHIGVGAFSRDDQGEGQFPEFPFRARNPSESVTESTGEPAEKRGAPAELGAEDVDHRLRDGGLGAISHDSAGLQEFPRGLAPDLQISGQFQERHRFVLSAHFLFLPRHCVAA
jgi:hypothetical protein